MFVGGDELKFTCSGGWEKQEQVDVTASISPFTGCSKLFGE